MWCIVEVQGFSTSNAKFIPKELVFLDQNASLKKFLFKPPVAVANLTRKDYKTILWATRQYHMMQWNSGDIAYEQFENILSSETSKYTHILTKGRDKMVMLSKVLNRPIIDMSIARVPKYEALNSDACSFHYSKTAHCAERNARSAAKSLDGHPDLELLLGPSKQINRK
jgi:hypothetical protein